MVTSPRRRPVFVSTGKDSSASNQEAMIIFAVGCNLAGMLWLLAPRIALRIHVAGWRIGRTREIPEVLVKLLYGCCLLPMVVLLPVHLHANLQHRPKRALVVCMLGVPLLSVCEAVRTAHAREAEGMRGRMAVAAFGLVVPVGCLLPMWLAVGPTEPGETALLLAMLVCVCGVLLAWAVLTFTVKPHLPFALLDYLLVGGSTSLRTDRACAAVAVLLPTAVLLPVYFWAQLSAAGGLVVLTFLGISTVLLACMLGKSMHERTTMGQNGVTSLLKLRPTSQSVRTNGD
jgi:hypothetical protein